MIQKEEIQDHVDRLREEWARELPDLDTTPMAVLGRAYRLSTLIAGPITETFAAHGIDRGEFDVLASLRRSGAPYRLTPTDLYTALMISSGSLTHRLKRLQKAGLVGRKKSSDDGRSMAVELTPRGREVVEAAFRADMNIESRFLDGLNAEEVESLAKLLRKLNHSLETKLHESGGT